MSVFDGHSARATRMTIEFAGKNASRSWKDLAVAPFAFLALLMLTTDMMKPRGYAMQVETSREARQAALAGTRQMIHADEFAALVGALIEAGAVPRPIMALALDSLADRLIRKARGEMEADFQVFPTEMFDRARELSAQAAMIRCAS